MVEVRIYYEDTDLAGVVYHANYLRYFERSRTEWLRGRGYDLEEAHRRGIVFTVVRAYIEYRRPAFYGDLLRVETFVMEVRGSRFTLGYRVLRAGESEPLAKGWTELAAVNAQTGRPLRIPAELRALLTEEQQRGETP